MTTSRPELDKINTSIPSGSGNDRFDQVVVQHARKTTEIETKLGGNGCILGYSWRQGFTCLRVTGLFVAFCGAFTVVPVFFVYFLFLPLFVKS